MAKHPVFPDVPRRFWRRFHKSWGDPLGGFEQTITLATSFGDDPDTPYFDSEDAEYWHVLRSLHSRTCLHARGVLALLTNGLVDPAWAQWRVCHESATIALFIANDPQMAPRYLRHSLVNAHHLAQVLSNTQHHDAPDKSELDDLDTLAELVMCEHERDFGYKPKSRGYGWSGLKSFGAIEASVQKNWRWEARAEYVFASERIHTDPRATQPILNVLGEEVFPRRSHQRWSNGPSGFDLPVAHACHVGIDVSREKPIKRPG